MKVAKDKAFPWRCIECSAVAVSPGSAEGYMVPVPVCSVCGAVHIDAVADAEIRAAGDQAMGKELQMFEIGTNVKPKDWFSGAPVIDKKFTAGKYFYRLGFTDGFNSPDIWWEEGDLELILGEGE